MQFIYAFYSVNILYMFRADKLFILRRPFLLYMQILVCIMHQEWLAASTIEAPVSSDCKLKAAFEGILNTYAVGSKSFRPDIQKPHQMENAVRDI